MSYTKTQLSVPQLEDANGNPASGYTISSYIWDTSTPTPMYTSSAGDGSATSFTLNSLGQPQTGGGTAVDIFLDSAIVYKFIIRDAGGVQVGPTIGPISAGRADDDSVTLDGGVSETVSSILEQRVYVTRFMTDAQRADVAAGTCSLDVSAAVQDAIDYCATFNRWPTLIIPGRCRIDSPITIDRTIDGASSASRFRIVGEGPGAGFYVNSAINLFETTLSFTTEPISQFINFEHVLFEASSNTLNAYVLKKGFLRVTFDNCEFALIKCANWDIYAQSIYFSKCRVRDWDASSGNSYFFTAAGFYDIKVNNKNSFLYGGGGFRQTSNTIGTLGCDFSNNYYEWNDGHFLNLSGVAGVTVSENYFEKNAVADIALESTTMQNQSIVINGNSFVTTPANQGDANFYNVYCGSNWTDGRVDACGNYSDYHFIDESGVAAGKFFGFGNKGAVSTYRTLDRESYVTNLGAGRVEGVLLVTGATTIQNSLTVGTTNTGRYMDLLSAGATLHIEPSSVSGANGVSYQTSFVSGGYGPHKFYVGATQYGEVSASGIAATNHGTTGAAANAYIDSGSGLISRSTSSMRYKKDAEPIEASAYDRLLSAANAFIWYRSNTDVCKNDDPTWSWYGMSAEAVAEIDPRFVFWGYNDEDYDITEEGRKLKSGAVTKPQGVDYARMGAMLIPVVKDLVERVRKLEGG